ncbi:MAG: aminotransferase class V-fold PLP-dependent enzyme [Nitrososphaeria archaeon]
MDIYEKLGVRKVINASSHPTTLGGAIMRPETVTAMIEASKYSVVMAELHKKAGEIIAEFTGAEAALVTSGAASAIVLGVAGCMTGLDRDKILRLPDTRGMKNEVIIQKSHINMYSNLVRHAGARMVIVDSREEKIVSAISDNTALIFHVAGRDHLGVPLEKIISIAKNYNIPVLVDAAPDLPPKSNLRRFINLGADLVAFSGGKALRGPNDTGILCGKKKLIEAAYLNSYIGMYELFSTNTSEEELEELIAKYGGLSTIGRSMKVSKEQIVGLIVALQRYIEEDEKKNISSWSEKVKYIGEKLKNLPNISVKVFSEEETVPPIDTRSELFTRVEILFNEKIVGKTVTQVKTELLEGFPRIAASVYKEGSLGKIIIYPQSLQADEEKLIVFRLKEIFTN